MKKCTFLFISLLFIKVLFAQPVIDSFTPGKGPVGTTVTIEGTGFSTTPANNIVYFGAVKTSVSNATDTTLTVTVPAGATYQPVTVTTANLTAYSLNPFIVTFAGGSGPFTSSSFLPKIELTAGMYPHSVSLADFNGDGKTDLLVCKGSSNTVSVFPNTSTSDNIYFASKLEFAATGNNHEGSATGDLDGDGRKDFVITNSHNSHSVSVYKNTSIGSISFAPKMDYPVENTPYSVAIGDLNGDGKPDLAIVNSGSNTISVYKNISMPGTISFDARTDFTVGSSPYNIAIGDLDGDGKADLAITTQGTSSALSVMKNTSTAGTISFDLPVDHITIAGLFTVSIGDLDGDNKPDLAAASAFSNSVLVLRNTSTTGNLSFDSQVGFGTANYPVSVSISDLDGDGKPDLVTTNRYSDNVSVLKNISLVGNISFAGQVDYATDDDPFHSAIGDLDGDSRPDIVVANSAALNVSVLRNIIGANIAPAISSFTPTSGISGTIVKINGSNFSNATSVKFGGVEASSFTVDSATGITATVGTGASGDVSVTTGYGTATLAGFSFNGPVIDAFTPTVGVSGTIVIITGSNFTGVTEVKFGGTSVASFTVNSPTNITATIGAGSSGSVTVTTATGTATLAGFSFGAPTIASFTPASGTVGSTVTIIGTNFNPTAQSNIVFFGAVKAIVSSATSTQLNVIVPAGATYQPITVTTNYLTAYSAQPFIVTFQSYSLAITENSFSVAGNYGTGTYPFAISISDLNDDGKPDLVTANSVGNSMSIIKNSSTGGTLSFNAKVDFSTGPDPKRIAIGDLDGDGKPDMVVTNFNAGNASTISVFRNTSTNGDISFALKADYSSGNGSIDVGIADMNEDGKPDIIVSSGNSGIFSIFKNTTVSAGTISFAAKQDYTLLTHPDNIAIADLDKDGKPDLITSNFSNSSISIFRNTSAGGNLSLAPGIHYGTGLNPSYITTGDVDGDGKLDLAVTNYTSGNILFFKNYSTAGIISFGVKRDLILGTTNISIADLNGDGKLDLFAGRGLSGMVSILENIYSVMGDFSFATSVNFTTGTYDTFVSVGDLDGDGKPELAASNTIENTVTILKNKIGEPEITSISPSTGVIGQVITLTGSRLTEATSVKFGGTPANSFTVISATQIDAVVGGGSSGNITVTTPLGIASIAGFSFIPEISSGGPVTFCKEGSVTLTSSASSNNQWHKDGVAISGSTAKTLVISTSGTYTVKTTSNGITTASPTGVTVTSMLIPAPIISRDAGNNLASSGVTGNQWYENGNLIPGATNQMYQPAQNAIYTVKITANGCTSDFSTPYNFSITGTIDLGNNQYINLYPNPLKDKLNLNWNINGMPVLNIEITDLQGRQMLLNKNIYSGIAIDVSQLPQGIYFIRIYSNPLKINNTIKIIKEN